MLKGKGVFAVIAIILVVGLGITSYTSHYINKQKSMASDTAGGFTEAREETTAGNAPMEAAAPPKEQAAESKSDEAQAGGAPNYYSRKTADSAADSQASAAKAADSGAQAAPGGTAQAAAEIQMNADGEGGAETTQETAADQASLVMISPLSGVLEPVYVEKEETAAAASLAEQKDAYLKRLDELSAQIDKLWKADADATSNSMKQTADYELKMWDNELNKIYQEVRKSLNEADAEALKETELQWIKDRDAKALAASKQIGNSSLESLEYTRTLAASTKARTYELVEIYFTEE